MPYDPRMLQMARMGIGMMGPQQGSAFGAREPQRPKQWWEQPLPAGQSANQPANSPDDANSAANSANSADSAKQPSLLQMLMLGGPATYSGTPAAAGSPQAKAWTDMQGLFKSAGPWGLLGGMGLPGGTGWGGGGKPG